MVFYGYRREVHKFSSQPTDRRPLNLFRLHKFPKTKIRNANGTFKFRQMWPRLNPQKERLTKDVRYQEFNEVTPDCSDENSQGSLHFMSRFDNLRPLRLDIVVNIWYSHRGVKRVGW